MRRSAGRLVRAAGVVSAVAAALLVVAGCGSNQPGDTNPGSGYTNNVSDLQVKIPALRSDPCRGRQADQLFANCGRYVTEVANVVAALRADVPGQTGDINALAGAVHSFQSLGCDTAGGSPSQAQRSGCPQALTSIGTDLDRLGQSLTSTPPSS
jgi:outer membrane murein-binding lipoprotein Lpp